MEVLVRRSVTDSADLNKFLCAFRTDLATALVIRDLESNSWSEPLAQEVEESCWFEAIL